MTSVTSISRLGPGQRLGHLFRDSITALGYGVVVYGFWVGWERTWSVHKRSAGWISREALRFPAQAGSTLPWAVYLPDMTPGIILVEQIASTHTRPIREA